MEEIEMYSFLVLFFKIAVNTVFDINQVSEKNGKLFFELNDLLDGVNKVCVE